MHRDKNASSGVSNSSESPEKFSFVRSESSERRKMIEYYTKHRNALI